MFSFCCLGTPLKALRQALLEGDEEKAIEIYTAVTKGHSLELELNPSLPFPFKTNDLTTPLHLAAAAAMETIFMSFVEHGGSPNVLDSNNESCLHSLCRRSDRSEVRRRIMEFMLTWHGKVIDGTYEKVSVNMVDLDGNAAAHYAAASGLVDCIMYLVVCGAIMSIVNKDQMTTCEMADANGHTILANMLEEALLFQPVDDEMGAFLLLDSQSNNSHEADPSIYIVDSASFLMSGLEKWKKSVVQSAAETIGEPRNRAEVILDLFDWNLERVIQEFCANPDKVFVNAGLSSTRVVTYTPLPRPRNQISDVNIANKTHEEAFVLDDLDDIYVGGLGDCKDDAEALSINHCVGKEDHGISQSQSEFCVICSECMTAAIHPLDLDDRLEPLSAADSDSNDKHQSVAHCMIVCDSGHKFCGSCWSAHNLMQVREDGGVALRCPAFKCGEYLSDEWCRGLLGAEMERKMVENRLRRIVDRNSTFQWCPRANCTCIVQILDDGKNSISGYKSGDNVDINQSTIAISRNASFPKSAICGVGHAFCLLCNEESHAPCSCSDWSQWKAKVNREMERAGEMKSNGNLLSNQFLMPFLIGHIANR